MPKIGNFRIYQGRKLLQEKTETIIWIVCWEVDGILSLHMFVSSIIITSCLSILSSIARRQFSLTWFIFYNLLPMIDNEPDHILPTADLHLDYQQTNSNSTLFLAPTISIYGVVSRIYCVASHRPSSPRGVWLPTAECRPPAPRPHAECLHSRARDTSTRGQQHSISTHPHVIRVKMMENA